MLLFCQRQIYLLPQQTTIPTTTPHSPSPCPCPSPSPCSTLLTEKGNWPLMESALICLLLSTNSIWNCMKINRGEFVCGHCSKIVFLAVQAFVVGYFTANFPLKISLVPYSKKGRFFAQNIISSLLKERFPRMNLLINHHRTESANDHWKNK